MVRYCKSLNSYIPNRGYSANELMNFVREIIVSKKYKLLITLDEIDFVHWMTYPTYYMD